MFFLKFIANKFIKCITMVKTTKCNHISLTFTLLFKTKSVKSISKIFYLFDFFFYLN